MSEIDHKKLMKMAIDRAENTMSQNIGGPFGALIINEKNEVVAVASNTVLRDHDPTAHAEINAIRDASKLLGTHDLSGCTLYATSYPCPMCLGAIIWSNIKNVFYGCTPSDAEKIGFRDAIIYDFINSNGTNKKQLNLQSVDRTSCLKLFETYHNQNKKLY